MLAFLHTQPVEGSYCFLDLRRLLDYLQTKASDIKATLKAEASRWSACFHHDMHILGSRKSWQAKHP
eukprot:4806691-Amphidinium_carterae.1